MSRFYRWMAFGVAGFVVMGGQGFAFEQKLTQPLQMGGMVADESSLTAQTDWEGAANDLPPRLVFFNADTDALLSQLKTYRRVYRLGQLIHGIHFLYISL